MTKDIRLEEFEKYIKRNNSNPRCYICGKELLSIDLDKVEYVKTKRNSAYFVHRECVLNKNKSGV